MDIKYDFTNRNYIVTGASSGMGRSCCEELLGAGARVYGIDRAEKSIDHERYSHYSIDVADDGAVAEAVGSIIGECGKVDGLVNAAGIFANGKPFYELEPAEWDRVLDTNLKGMFLMSKYVSRNMIDNRRGRIVNFSCIRSSIFKENMAEYAASKGGVSSFTSAMALDLAPYNIRVNAVVPGFIRTGMTEKSFEDPAVVAASEQLIPTGRIGEPSDVAGVVMFLLSDAADYITGAQIHVDGGYVIRK